MGYLNAADAARYSPVIQQAVCAWVSRADIVGGWVSRDGHRYDFGVVLTEPVPAPEHMRMIPGYFLGVRDVPAGRAEELPGLLLGRHYTEYTELVRELKRTGHTRFLLVALINLVEAESQATGYEVAPWYYKEYAVTSRKLKEPDQELAILRRYVRLTGHNEGELVDRLRKLEANG